MDDCIYQDFTVVGDNNNRLKDACLKVAEGNSTKAITLSTFFNDPEFIKFVREKAKSDLPIGDINLNITKKALKEWYNKKVPSVANTAVAVQNTTLQGFSSTRAKSVAITHTADLVISFINYNNSLSKSNRVSNERILNQVLNKLANNFLESYAIPFYKNYINNGGKNNEALDNLLKAKKFYANALKEADKRYGTKKSKEIQEKYFEFREKLIDVDKRLRNSFINLLLKHGNIREKNYANLVLQAFSDKNGWFEQVFNIKKTSSISKSFMNTLEDEDITYWFIEDEDVIHDEETDSLNKEVNRFPDEQEKNKSFIQLVDTNIRTYISGLHNLNSIWDGKSAKNYDTDNELGVNTRINSGFVINNIMSRCDFSNGVNGLIKSLEMLISDKKELFGLSAMIVKMKQDSIFARSVFYGLGNPVVAKTMIEIGDKIDYSRSNSNASARLNLTFTMNNQIKSTIFDNHSVDTTSNIEQLIKKFNNKNLDSKTKEYIKNSIIKFFNIYFPNISSTIIANSLNNDDNYKRILNNIKELSIAIDNIIEQRNTKKFANIDFNVAISPISSIVDILLPYTIVNTELNSPNAKGNQSSDSLNNSYITNLLKQINFGTEKDYNAGLKNLYEFISKSPQYKHSPIFFGVYDKDGNELVQGLFNKNGDINPNSRELIRVALFNGIKNPLTKEGELYNSMSKADYFITSLYAFHNVYKDYEHYNANDHFSNAGYFMRVPSDAPKNFIIHAPKINYHGFKTNTGYNRHHALFATYRQILKGEIENFIFNLNNVYDKNNNFKLKKNTNGIFKLYHYDGEIFNGKELTGKVFKFLKLHNTTNVNVDAIVKQILSLYGGAQPALINKDGSLNLERTDIIKNNNGTLELSANFEQYEEAIDNFLERYFDDLINDALNDYQEYTSIINNKFSENQILEMVLNTNIMYANFDDLFEGDTKFYKSPQDFLKRAKEVQAGGNTHDNWSVNDKLGGPIQELTGITYTVAGRTINAKNGFRAITINNTVRPSDEAANIKAMLIKQGVNKETIDDIVKRFAYNTKTNDAQSYITIDELANRLFAKGQLLEYKSLFDKLLAKDENGNPVKLTEQDLKELTKFGEKIQVQKNFYFDKQYDIATGTYYPRQIKNAEFVLIPQLLPEGSSLRTLYDMMIKHDIQQVNTAETDKAAKRYIIDFWDNNGNIKDLNAFETELINGNCIENYYYRYLYEQQQVAEHMEDAENKAGIQIMKKIIDNAGNYSPIVQENIKKLFDHYCAKIEDSFNKLFDNLGLKINEDGSIGTKAIIKDGKVIKPESDTIDFTEFYKRGKEEAKRLGMDSNFMAYFDVDNKGNAILPNYMNTVQTKLESIAQAIFNSAVTRQKLPGYHAAQITNVGFDKKLGYHKDGSPYTEIRLTPWFNMDVFEGKTNEEILAELAEIGCDLQIIYRIPTEGKQSIAIGKVVDLLNSVHGSTIVVADEWVTQTGSDFDVDSVYGITYKFKRNKETGKLEKITEGIDGHNNAILDAMIAIMSDPTVMEENLSCSNFDEINDNIDYFNKINPAIKASNLSSYDIFTQMRFMETAMSGAALKALSVTRDNFTSISSYIGTKLKSKGIAVKYNLKPNVDNYNTYDAKTIIEAYPDAEFFNNNGDYVSDITKAAYCIVYHNTIGNSANNRNVRGRLMTVYSSQTTAHILDAIKTGAIFNENLYTFGNFKTLIDLGIDYRTAIAFLQQPVVTDIVDNYNANKSIYSDNINWSTKPITDTLRNIAKVTGFKGNEFVELKKVKEYLQHNKNISEAFKELFGAELDFTNKQLGNSITLDSQALQNRLKRGKINNIEISEDANTTYKDIAFDLGMIIFYDNLNNITKGIENVARVCNSDKFGAKQTVYGTRNKIKDMLDITNNKENKAYGLLTDKDGIDIIESIYPGIKNADIYNLDKLKIDIKNSSYPYLASFVNYATIPSIKCNSRLFILENETMYETSLMLENAIGKPLNENTEKEFKKYIVSYIYANSPSIIRPLTVNSEGRLIYNEKMEKEYAESGNPKYWNEEFRRIKSYRIKEDYNFEIEDINNITEEELDKFNQLTPVQKVNFIKQHFIGDAGIFEYIESNYYKGEYTLKYKDTTDDIENLYKLINEAYFNTNPLIKLAVVDLIKYAYIVEGGNFKKGAISKLITKEILLANNDNYGLSVEANHSIIDEFNRTFDELIQGENRKDIIEKFIRNNSYIIDNVKISKKTPFNVNRNSGVYFINSDDKLTRSTIKYNKDFDREYIRLTQKRIINNKETTIVTLYKIDSNNNEVILYPINILNGNETTDYSINPNNNNHYVESFYKGVISNRYDSENTTIPIIKVENIIKDNNINIHTLTENLNSKTPTKKKEAENIIALIKDAINLPVKGSKYGIITYESYTLNNLVNNKFNNPIIQEIEIDGVPTEVSISKIKNKRLLRAINKINTPNFNVIYDKLTPQEQKFIDTYKGGLKFPSLYRVAKIEKTNDTNDIIDDSIIMDESDSPMANNRRYIDINGAVQTTTELDEITDIICKDIIHHYKMGNRDNTIIKLIKDFKLNNINERELSSIINNEKYILTKAAGYYISTGNKLLERASKFILQDGREFDITDVALYEAIDNEDDLSLLTNLLLDIKTFGDNIKPILLLEPDSENLEIQKAIKDIQAIIHKVSNSNKINKAFDLIYNVAYARKSKNPMIKNNVIKLREAFDDIKISDLLFSGIGEIANNQVQVVINDINNKLKKVERIDVKKARDDFRNKYKTIESKAGTLNWNNIVTHNGTLVQDYSDEFFETRKKLYEAVENATPNTLEYHKAKLALEEFNTKNIHRPIKQSYYETINRLTKNILNIAGDLYTEYMKLNDIKQNILVDINLTNKERNDKIRDINNKMRELASIYDSNLNEKVGDDRTKAIALREYLNKKQELNQKVFEYTGTDEFNTKYKYYSNIIEKYESKHPNLDLSQRLNDDAYLEAYNWIQSNTITQLNSTTRNAINKAFALLRTDAAEIPDFVRHILKGKDVYDENGKLDVTKISIEDARAIKEAKEQQFAKNPYISLLKNVPKYKPSFSQDYFDTIKRLNNNNFNSNNTDLDALYDEINNILSKVCKSGEDITWENISKLNKEDLTILGNLYFQVQNPNRAYVPGQTNPVAEFIKNNSIQVTNDEAWEKERQYYFNNLKGKKDANESDWKKIFVARDKNGAYKFDKDGHYIPNPAIYKYRIPKEKYANKEVDAAKKLLNDNVSWELTEEYYKAADEAYITNTYEEWYNANHYYNPITGEMEPHRYWTKMTINPNGTLNSDYETIPIYNNTERNIKDNYKNDNYDANKLINYNKNTGEFNNTKNLTDKELAMRDFLQETLNTYASTYNMRILAEKGFLPRKAKIQIDSKFIAKQITGAFGITSDFRQPDWTYDINYASETLPPAPMMETLKDKSYKQLPNKEDYVGREDEYNKLVDEIKVHNREIDANLLDRNWEKVFDEYIQQVVMYNAKNKLRGQAQLLLEDLKQNPATKINWLDKVSKLSGGRINIEDQNNTYKLVRNWYHRVFREEFKQKHKLNPLMTFAQNYNSAKYMLFNVTGGIANLATGAVNALGESLAKEYFTNKDWATAVKLYGTNVINIIAGQYNPESNNLPEALIKLGNVVDFDAILERHGNNVAELTKRIRDKGYVLQSAGEHIMQNTIFLALLQSNRLYRDPVTGKLKVGDLNNYMLDADDAAFREILRSDNNLETLYNNFINNIKTDKTKQHQYGTYKRNIINDFIKENGGRELQKKYNDLRNKKYKEAKAEFNNLPKVYDQFKLVDGYAVIDHTNEFTDDMFAEIVNKTISINQRIHGIYDKINAAYIEQYWYGSVIMQYHKHIYPMIKKLYRKKILFNEARGTIEKGAFNSLWDLTIQGYKDAAETNSNIDNIILRSIVNTIIGTKNSILDLSFNYNSMSNFERANVRRALSFHLGCLSGILISIALHAGFDDDDFEDNNFLNLCLYHADRLSSESMELHPFMLHTTLKTNWNNPVAAIAIIQDAKAATDIITSSLFDDEFEWDYTTGRYKGENKLWVLTRRNIPIYRVYDRLTNMAKSNKYFRIGNTPVMLVNPKKIGNAIQGKE